VKYLDLFSGIGGFALGAYWAGWRFEKHYFSEVDPWCCELYQKRFPDAIPLGDIKGIDCETLADTEGIRGWSILRPNGQPERKRTEASSQDEGWIITGGFPCQDISVAGKGEGIGGERSGLWFEYWRIIRDLRPRYAIVENVGALTFRGLDAVLGSLAEIGYDAEWQDIRASDVGAPHRRERIWIVAYPRREHDNGRRCGRTDETETGSLGRSSRCSQIKDVSDTDVSTDQQGKPQSDIRTVSGSVGESRHTTGWATEPDVGRLAHGVSRRVDRLRGLGNAIVPQIAELIFRRIADGERAGL